MFGPSQLHRRCMPKPRSSCRRAAETRSIVIYETALNALGAVMVCGRMNLGSSRSEYVDCYCLSCLRRQIMADRFVYSIAEPLPQ
jgi:hypothetical protein